MFSRLFTNMKAWVSSLIKLCTRLLLFNFRMVSPFFYQYSSFQKLMSNVPSFDRIESDCFDRKYIAIYRNKFSKLSTDYFRNVNFFSGNIEFGAFACEQKTIANKNNENTTYSKSTDSGGCPFFSF